MDVTRLRSEFPVLERIAYLNVHVEWSPAHGATSGFSAVHSFASVKNDSGRARFGGETPASR